MVSRRLDALRGVHALLLFLSAIQRIPALAAQFIARYWTLVGIVLIQMTEPLRELLEQFVNFWNLISLSLP